MLTSCRLAELSIVTVPPSELALIVVMSVLALPLKLRKLPDGLPPVSRTVVQVPVR